MATVVIFLFAPHPGSEATVCLTSNLGTMLPAAPLGIFSRFVQSNDLFSYLNAVVLILLLTNKWLCQQTQSVQSF